jgi:hypothetical protein
MKSPGSGRNVLDLFSALPYEGGNCGNVKEISLMAQCDPQNYDTFLRRLNLFPPKIPKISGTTLLECQPTELSPL